MRSIQLVAIAILAAVSTSQVIGCEASNSNPKQSAVGTVRLPLTATVGGNNYVLTGTFVITNSTGVATTLSSSSASAAATLVTTLGVGQYTITLLPGWQLSIVSSTGTASPIAASLISPATQNVNITDQQNTIVTYQFDASGIIIQTGQGQLTVQIGVTESAGGSTGSGGAPQLGGSTAAGGAGGNSSTGGSTNTAGSTSVQQCTSALPAGTQPVDVSSPMSVVGTGTAASCTFSALNSAVTKGGTITFNCGAAPVTIAVTATLNLLTNKDTVIDGGNRVTLDGGNAVRILNYTSPNFMASNTRVTLQHLTLINGKTTPTQAIPTAPAPCSQGWNDGQGGALYMRDGNLTVIDCTFTGNQAAPLGPDTGGGAIYIIGSKNGALIVGSTFSNNTASNAGAIGGLFAELDIYNSVFQNNSAIGNGANGNDPSRCSAVNNGQNEIGSGGDGGAIYQDGGSSTNVILCGDLITSNAAGANAFGGGVFMTSNDITGTISIRDTTITGNTGGFWTQLQQGGITNLGTAFGINALSATVTNSKLQGVN